MAASGRQWRKTVLVVAVGLLAASAAGAAPMNVVERRVRTHLAQARADGVDPEDFAHLFFAFSFRRTLPDWRTAEVGLDQLATVRDVDPLMAAELAHLAARLAVDAGHPDQARARFAEHGGLSRWWVHGPLPLGELEDFPTVAARPPGDDGWRPAAGTDPLGWVRVAGLAWPGRRQLVFLATTVESPVEQAVAVRLGAAQAARAWLNGGEILTTPRPLARAEDQVSGGGVLAAGANLLVVAVAAESADGWLRVRLTAPDGGPLARPARELELAPAARPPARRAAAPVRSLEAELERAVERQRPGAALARAAYLVTRPPQPVEVGDARLACRAARAEAPGEARLLEWVVTTEATAQRVLLEEAVAADPDLVWARLELARWLHQRGLVTSAHEVLEPLLAEPVAEAVALDLDATRWGQITLPRLQALLASHPTAADVGLILARRALDGRRWDLARSAVDQVATFAAGLPALAEVREELARSCGDGAALAASLVAALDDDPNQPDLRVRSSRLAAAAGDLGAARQALVTGLERCPDHPELLIELAALDHLEGADADAAARARTVLAARPQERRAERLLELLGDAGEDTSWRRDLAELRRLAAAVSSDAAAVAVVNHVELRFLPGNLTEERVQEVYLIRDAARAKHLAAHRLPWVPERQRLRVLAARVVKRDGSEVSAAQRDTPRLAEPELNIYYDTRLRLLAFPGLDDGDLVEIAYILTETAEVNETGPYLGGILRLGKEVPVALTEVEMHGRSDELPAWELAHLAGEPEVNAADGVTRLRWSWRDLPALPADQPPPPALLVTPHLVYSNHPDWGELAGWYGRHIAPRLRSSRALEETAQRIVAPTDDRLQRIARLYRFVTDEIRYVGLEFGEHRFRPFSADWVLSHGIGDCKDKATLLVALLAEVGIRAQVAMIRTADLGPVATSLAVLHGFNHAIAYLPDDDLWLDGTASGHDPFPPPAMDQGAYALVVAGDVSRPTTTPEPGAGTSTLSYTLVGGDEAFVDLTIRTEDTGEAASLRRAYFSGTGDPRRYAAWVQGQFPGAELVGEPELRLRPGVSPAVMSLTARVRRSALKSGRGLVTYPGALELAAELAPSGRRVSPLALAVRPDLRWSLRVDLGRSPTSLPAEVDLATDFGRLRLTVAGGGDGYVLTGFFHLEPGLVPPERAPDLRAFLVAVERHLSTPLETP